MSQAPIKNAYVIPHSIEAEQAVIGGILLDNERMDDALELIRGDDFFQLGHRYIFEEMHALSVLGADFDAVILSEHLQAKNQLAEAGGLAYLATLTRDTPTSANVRAYAKIVLERSKARRTMVIGQRLVRDAQMDAEAGGIAIRELLELNEDRRQREHQASDMVSAAWDVIDASTNAKDGLVGVNTGFKTLNRKLGGFHPGDLIVVGARPAIGKTAFIANTSIRSGVPNGIISTEQPHQQLGMRMLALQGMVSVHRMRVGKLTEDDWKKLTASAAEVAQASLWINDKPFQHLSDIIRQARKWKVRHDIQTLYVDYIQRIEGDDPRLSLRERVGEVVKGLKNIARELNMPVVALAMVRREVELRDDKVPGLSDFKESGEIEQEADIAITLHRDGAYDPDKEDGTCVINVCKNRHGPTGRFDMAWNGEYMRFDDPGEEPAI